MNKRFWKNKKVLITGHTGFKGAWMAIWLHSMGAKVIGYALSPPTNPSIYKECELGNIIESLIEDVRNLDKLENVFSKHKPEIVFHMAAQPLVRYSYDNPVETYSTNLMGTVNILECVRNVKGIRSVVVVTTDKCYENKEWIWAYRENEPMGGNDPYSNSKACAELITEAYRKSYFSGAKNTVGIATARAGNVIGGGDWANDRLIPDIVRSIENDEELIIRNPTSIRPWQHVLEPLNGYMLLAEKLYTQPRRYSGAWNFGPNIDDIKDVKWIVQKLYDIWGIRNKIKIMKDIGKHEARSLKLDNTKAREELKWMPKITIDEALAMIYEWQIEKNRGKKVYEIILSQIEQYERRK